MSVRGVYIIPTGDCSGRSRKSGTPVLSGTFDCGNLVRRLAALQLFSDGSDRVCVYSCNGSADEIEKNYGLFPDSCVVLLSRMLRIRTADSRNILHVLTVFPTFILPDFYFTIPMEKCYTAVGGKRYLHAAVSFFRRAYLKPRNFTEVNCMDSCDSTGRSTKCGVKNRQAQNAAISAMM